MKIALHTESNGNVTKATFSYVPIPRVSFSSYTFTFPSNALLRSMASRSIS